MKIKITGISFFIFLLGLVALAGLNYFSRSPAENSDNQSTGTQETASNPAPEESAHDAKPEVGDEATPLEPAASEPQAESNEPFGQSLVKLPNNNLKQAFLANNSIPASELKPTPELKNTYLVERPAESLEAPSSAVSINPRRQYRALLTPDDPIYPQWYTNKISAPKAWDITTGSADIAVAVIDTGFTLSHEDLTGRWLENTGEGGAGCTDPPAVCDAKKTNGVDDDLNGKVDDWRGWDFAQDDNNPSAGSTNPGGGGVEHGTMVSGLVGATGNNGVGIAGVNWVSDVLALQALDDDGFGFTEDVVGALDYAVEQGTNVVNLSLGTTGNDPLLKTAVDNAVSAGITVVAATGNCGASDYAVQGCDYQGQVLYPAKYSNVISVGAIDQNDKRASFSSYEPDFVDIVAPGAGSIRTTLYPSGYSNSANGTSFASPIVSGVVSLLLSVDDSLTPGQIKSTITNYADRVPAMKIQSYNNNYGSGRINSFISTTVASGFLPVYRLYQGRVHDHLLTASPTERDTADRALGFRLEGIAFWTVPSTTPGVMPVYRLYNGRVHDHLVTTSVSERNIADTKLGFRYEGIAFYAVTSDTVGAKPAYRLYQGKVHDHLVTISASERDAADNNLGFRFEGIVLYASTPQ